MNKQIDEILQKRMDRKDFLKHVGLGVALITGTAGIVKFLKGGSVSVGEKPKSQPVSLGYGSSVYGGRPAKT